MKIWTTKSGIKIIRVLSGRSNVFLISDKGNKILIDTSTRSRWAILNRRLKNLNVDHIECLILTHTHFDHAGNALRIKNRYNTLVIVHRTEAEYLYTGRSTIPDGTNLLTRYLVKYLAARFMSEVRNEGCQSDILIDTKYDLVDFGINAYIIHTPGHSAGSVSVVVDDEVAIVGDAMFGVFKYSVFPPYADDSRQMVESWGKLLSTGCRLFIPSHGTPNSRELVKKEYKKRTQTGNLNTC